MASSTNLMEVKLLSSLESKEHALDEPWVDIQSIFDSRDLISQFNHALMPSLFKYFAKKGWQEPTTNSVGNYVLSWLPTNLIGQVYEPAYKLSTDQANAKHAHDIAKGAIDLCTNHLGNRDKIALIILLALEKLLELRAKCPATVFKKPEVVEMIDNAFVRLLGFKMEEMPISKTEFLKRKTFLLKNYKISAEDEKAILKELDKAIVKFSKLSPEGHPRELSTLETIEREFDRPQPSLSESEPRSEPKSTSLL